MIVRLVADDLTGALDAAAPFARDAAPVAVFRDAVRAAAHPGAWALDAATRGEGPAKAEDAARQIAPTQATGLAFRKIDSLLRGHVAVEIAAASRAGKFGSVVIAPAFPAQGRVTRRGRQYARNPDGIWNAVEFDLAAALAGKGLVPRVVGAAGIAGPGAYLCDAETDADLEAIAAAGRRLPGPVLWCGSSGLARALAGGKARHCALPGGPVLGVIGSRHPVAMAEAARLEQRDPPSVLPIRAAASIGAAVSKAAQRLRAGRPVLVLLSLPELPAGEAGKILHRLAAEVTALAPSAVFASGGDTLAALTAAAGADHLDVEGEISPGVPLSRIAGGRWNGVSVVSKSGAFAAGDVLTRLFASNQEKRRAQA